MGEHEKVEWWGKPRISMVAMFGGREFAVEDRGNDIRLGRIVGGRVPRTVSIWHSDGVDRMPDIDTARRMAERFLTNEDPAASVETTRRVAEVTA